MRKVSLFIAMSLDGYIADTRGEVNWIVGQSSDIENLDTYSKFIRDIDIILMGGIPIIKLLLNFVGPQGHVPHQSGTATLSWKSCC